MTPYADLLVVVTGVPAAGKSQLGALLAPRLGATLLSLDATKDELYAARAHVDDRHALRLAAEQALFGQIGITPGRVVVDIWVAPHRDEERIRALVRELARPVVEVLCRVPAEVAVERYARRTRSGAHLPADEPTLRRVRAAVDAIRPLGLGRCLEVDTSGPVDAIRVASLIETAVHDPPTGRREIGQTRNRP